MPKVNMNKLAGLLESVTLEAVKSDNSQNLISTNTEYAGFIMNLTKALECFARVKDADILNVQKYLNNVTSWKKLEGIYGWFAIYNGTLFTANEVGAEGDIEGQEENDIYGAAGEVTAPENQEFLNAINLAFGSDFRMETFAGR